MDLSIEVCSRSIQWLIFSSLGCFNKVLSEWDIQFDLSYWIGSRLLFCSDCLRGLLFSFLRVTIYPWNHIPYGFDLKALVTGGAGFIGSHIVDHLIRSGKPVRVVDNLVSGTLDNLRQWVDHPLFEFMEIDLLDKEKVNTAVMGCDEVYHLAANPEVNAKNASPEDHFRQNIEATYNLLEAMRQDNNQKFIVFTSTSTVYGEPE